MTKKVLLSLLIGASVIVTAACGNNDENTNEEETATQEQAVEDNGEATEQPENGETAETPEMPEPDLADVPELVAEVNGEEINKEEFESAYVSQFQQMVMQAQMTGEEVDQTQLKEQVAESLVSQRLLIQETEERDIQASEEEIDQTLTELAEQNGVASSEEFLTALEEQGLTEEEVREQIASQVKMDKLIAEEAGELEASEEEVQEFYDEVKGQQDEAAGEEFPPLEDVKSEIQAQLVQQKQNEAIQTLVDSLREDAEVTIHI